MQYKTIKLRGENKHNPRRVQSRAVCFFHADRSFPIHFEMKSGWNDNESQ